MLSRLIITLIFRTSLNVGVKMSSRSIITLIVSWPRSGHEGRHEEVNCMTKHWQGHYPLILLYALLVLKASPQNTCISPTCTIHYKLLLLHVLCQVLAGNHLQHAAWWRNQSRAAVLRLQTRIWVLSIWYVTWVVSFKVVKRILLQWHLKLWWNILNLVLMAHLIVGWRKNLQCRPPNFKTVHHPSTWGRGGWGRLQ